MPPSSEENSLRNVMWSIALSGAVLTLASPLVFGQRGIVGVALGAAIGVANLWALTRIVRAFLNGAGLPWAILAAFKLVGLLAVVALVLKSGVTTVLPLLMGYGALPLGIVLGQISSASGKLPAPATSPDYADEPSEDARRQG